MSISKTKIESFILDETVSMSVDDATSYVSVNSADIFFKFPDFWLNKDYSFFEMTMVSGSLFPTLLWF